MKHKRKIDLNIEYQPLVSPYLLITHSSKQVKGIEGVIIPGKKVNQKSTSPKTNNRKGMKDIKENLDVDRTFSSSHGVEEKLRWS